MTDTNPVPANKRHHFDTSIRHQIRQLMVVDTDFYAFWYPTKDYGIIILSIMLSQSVMMTSVVRWPIKVVAYLLAILVIGSRQRALNNTLHMATHYAMARTRRLNIFVGSFLTAWPLLRSWNRFCVMHVKLHHHHLGDPKRDLDFQDMINDGWYEPNMTRRDVIYKIVGIFGPQSLLSSIKSLFSTKDTSPAICQPTSEIVQRSVFYLVILASAFHFGQLHNLFFYWVVPLATSFNWINQLCEVLDHFPLLNPKSSNSGQDHLEISRNRFLHATEDFFLGPHNDSLHLVHHLWPRLPDWKLHDAHQLMMQDRVYASANDSKPGLRNVIMSILHNFT